MDDENENIVIQHERYFLEASIRDDLSIVVETDYRGLELGEFLTCMDKLIGMASRMRYRRVDFNIDNREDYANIASEYLLNIYNGYLSWTDGRYEFYTITI